MHRIEKLALLRKEIERVRQKMYQTYQGKSGLLDHEVYGVSQELDSLIVTYQKLTRLELTDEYRNYWDGIRLFPLYQRIEALCEAEKRKTSHAYEATIRGMSLSNHVISAVDLFTRARQFDEEAILDYKARMASIEQAQQFVRESLIFLNAHWKAIESDLLFTDEVQISVPLDRVVLEITEQSQAIDVKSARRYLDHLRSLGMKVAIDDFGTGYSNFTLVSELEPEYVKLDKSIISQLDTSASARRTLQGMVSFARQVGTLLIAEGIETREQLEIVRDTGIPYGQGYYLGYPERMSEG